MHRKAVWCAAFIDIATPGDALLAKPGALHAEAARLAEGISVDLSGSGVRARAAPCRSTRRVSGRRRLCIVALGTRTARLQHFAAKLILLALVGASRVRRPLRFRVDLSGSGGTRSCGARHAASPAAGASALSHSALALLGRASVGRRRTSPPSSTLWRLSQLRGSVAPPSGSGGSASVASLSARQGPAAPRASTVDGQRVLRVKRRLQLPSCPTPGISGRRRRRLVAGRCSGAACGGFHQPLARRRAGRGGPVRRRRGRPGLVGPWIHPS